MSLEVVLKHRQGAFQLDASFVSEQGVTALFGRSGSGKTSIMRMIAGLQRPDEGRVVVDGEVLTDTGQGLLVPGHRRRFGYVFQEPRLFPHLTVRQNLLYGHWFAPKNAHRQSLDQVVDLLGIAALLPRRPAHLSGGEKQRVAIGRALLSAPRMLLMDEPLAALDEMRKDEILPYLEKLRDEMRIPIVYVSHSVAEVARLADRIVLVSDGRVVATGGAADVLRQPSIAIAANRRETGALLEGRIIGFDARHRIATVALRSVQLFVRSDEGSEGQMLRVHIPARDVILATSKPVGISAMNVLAGRVAATRFGPDDMMDVDIDCGGDVIQARVTELSCERLNLAPGKIVYAIIKTVALETG